MIRVLGALCILCILCGSAFAAEPPDDLYLANLTSPEVRRAIDSGRRVVILPTGGIEQNGPHMVLGKHDVIVRWTAGRIAQELGNALVAPVLSFVPEGGTDPLTGNMWGAGTIDLPPALFGAVLEAVAASLKSHGFRLICLIGDHGLSQAVQAQVAARLTAQWQSDGVRVLQVGDYYAANGQAEWLQAHGETAAAAARHAGVTDSSELLALAPRGLRPELMADGGAGRADAGTGRALLELKVAAAVHQIRAVEQ